MKGLISYLSSGHHGLWPSQQLFEPKSRVFHLTNGHSIKEIEDAKNIILDYFPGKRKKKQFST